MRIRIPTSRERGPAIHGSLDRFHPVDVTVDDAGAPFEDEACHDSIEVLAEEHGELGDRDNSELFGLTDPVGQQLASAVTDEVREGPGEPAGTRNVRAGEAGLVQVFDLPGAEAAPVAHDPCGDPARARDFRWCGWGCADFQGAQVGGECPVAAAESALADLLVQGAAVGDTCGVLLLQVGLEGVQLVGAAVSGAVEEIAEVRTSRAVTPATGDIAYGLFVRGRA